jgi:hypothetical protein
LAGCRVGLDRVVASEWTGLVKKVIDICEELQIAFGRRVVSPVLSVMLSVRVGDGATFWRKNGPAANAGRSHIDVDGQEADYPVLDAGAGAT